MALHQTELENITITSFEDMGEYTAAIMNYLDQANLPSYAYPEAYAFFVTKCNCPLERNDYGYMVFYDYPIEDSIMFNKIVRLMSNMNQCFFQKLNTPIEEAALKVRQLEHALAQAKMALADAELEKETEFKRIRGEV